MIVHQLKSVEKGRATATCGVVVEDRMAVSAWSRDVSCTACRLPTPAPRP